MYVFPFSSPPLGGGCNSRDPVSCNQGLLVGSQLCQGLGSQLIKVAERRTPDENTQTGQTATPGLAASPRWGHRPAPRSKHHASMLLCRPRAPHVRRARLIDTQREHPTSGRTPLPLFLSSFVNPHTPSLHSCACSYIPHAARISQLRACPAPPRTFQHPHPAAPILPDGLATVLYGTGSSK